MRAPRGPKFFQFHAVLGKILAKLYVGAPRELVPPPRGNPRSATEMVWSRMHCPVQIVSYIL